MLLSGRGCVHPWDPARGPPAAPGAGSQGLELSGLPALCPLARGRSVRWTPRRLPRPGPRHSSLGAGTCPLVWLLVLYSLVSIFATLGSPESVLPVSFRPKGLSGRSDPSFPPPPTPASPPARPCGCPPALACAASLALAPSLQAAPAPRGPGAAFPGPQPSKLGLDSVLPRASSRLPFPAAEQ